MNQQIVERGAAAERLLKHEDFIQVIGDLKAYHTQCLIGCSPVSKGESETRRHHHFMVIAFAEICDELQRSVIAAEAELNQHENNEAYNE